MFSTDIFKGQEARLYYEKIFEASNCFRKFRAEDKMHDTLPYKFEDRLYKNAEKIGNGPSYAPVTDPGLLHRTITVLSRTHGNPSV